MSKINIGIESSVSFYHRIQQIKCLLFGECISGFTDAHHAVEAKPLNFRKLITYLTTFVYNIGNI